MAKAVLMGVLLSTCVASPAIAQDACRDVLKDGPYSYQSYKDDSYFNQIIWSRFLQSTFQSSKSDHGGGFGVPIGEIVLGANYTEAQYNAKKQQIEREYFSQITASREIDVALMSGDEEVIRAWSGCMANRGGGMTARFEALSPVDVFMTVEYFNQGTRNSDRLQGDVSLPDGVTVVSNPACLRRRTRIVNGKPCVTQLRLPSATATMPVLINGQNSVATAWLPARIQLSREAKPYPFTRSHQLYDWAHKRTTQHRAAVELTAAEIADGWMFDPSTARVGLREISFNNRNNNCHSEYSNPTAMRFEFGYTIYAGNRRRNDGHMECEVNPYILMTRSVWVPMMREDGLIKQPGSMNALVEPTIEDVAKRKSAFE